MRDYPIFCYRCGLLSHSLKECSEGRIPGENEGDSQLQYGAWLRGEPLRRGGKEVVIQGIRRNTADHTKSAEGGPAVQPEQRDTAKGKKEEGSTPVNDMTSQGCSYPLRDVGAVTSSKHVSEKLHEEGKAKETEKKIEVQLIDLGGFGEEKSGCKSGLVEGMQWESVLSQGVRPILEERLEPQIILNTKEAGPSANSPEMGPLALSFDDKKGWVVENLGPTSRH